MKKSFLFLAVCAAALTACTSEEVIEEGVQSNAIGFQQVVNKPTRAIDATNLNTFYVFGYYTKQNFESSPITVFSGDKVTKTGEKDGKGVWSYANSRYWVPDATYKFFAYSCENNEGALDEDADNGTAGMSFDNQGYATVGISDYICDNGHQHDLVFAKNDAGIVGKQTGNEDVALTFSHILSKLKVKFVSKFPAGYDLKISAVNISNIYTTADYALTYSTSGLTASWTTKGTATNNILNVKDGEVMTASAEIPASGDTEKVDAVSAMTSDAYVIPHEYTNTNVQVSFKVEFVNEGVTVMERVFNGTWKPNWEVGKAYLYTISIDGEDASLEKIEFKDPELGTWIEADGPTINFGVPTNPAN